MSLAIGWPLPPPLLTCFLFLLPTPSLIDLSFPDPTSSRALLSLHHSCLCGTGLSDVLFGFFSLLLPGTRNQFLEHSTWLY